MSDLDKHIDKQIADFRRQLLGLTLRNPLLSCSHDHNVRAQIRVVNASHDDVFVRLHQDESFEVAPLPEPRDVPDDEDDPEFKQALSDHKARSLTYREASRHLQQSGGPGPTSDVLEREARDHVRLLLHRGEWKPERNLSPENLARRHGISPSFDLLSPKDGDHDVQDQAAVLQTLLHEQDLGPRLRVLRERSRSDLRDRGVNTLFAAFGFLEWYEDSAAQTPHLAPLVLTPVELDRASLRNRREYVLRATGEEPVTNAALTTDLKRRFDLELPDLHSNDTPESYFEKVEPVLGHERRWRIRRFLTIQVFSDAKLAIYADLDRDSWPEGGPLSQHAGVRELMSETGVADTPYADDHDIDGDDAAARLPTLIYDADSSQHSAIVDALHGGNHTIYGPPGTGKSQTITNLIAAGMEAGKTILFVAEKLTALDVVHKRLREAELDRYCFVLHSGGIRREAVRAALLQRVNAPSPDFDEATYRGHRIGWKNQRDALKLYAAVMGHRLGALRTTVHEILWKVIRLREATKTLPPSVEAIRIREEDALALTANDLQSTMAKVRDLVSAHHALGTPGPLPWRGIRRQGLAPIDVAPILHHLDTWRISVDGVANNAALIAGAFDTMTLDDVAQAIHALVLLSNNLESILAYDVEMLAREDIRRKVIAAADAATRASSARQTLCDRFALNLASLPPVDEIRAIAADASALNCARLTARELTEISKKELLKAGTIQSLCSTLDELHRLFGIPESRAETIAIIRRAVDRIRNTPRPTLLARTYDWVEERNHVRITQLRDSAERVRRERQSLAKRFDLKKLPAADDLRAAGNAVDVPSKLPWLSAKSRRAAKLFRTVRRVRTRANAKSMAIDLLRLADYVDTAESLMENRDGRALLSARWQGADTDLTDALAVSSWAAAVAKEFSGIEVGRAVRHTLFHGEIDAIDQIVNEAGTLENQRIEDYVDGDGTPLVSPAEFRERAKRYDQLAARFEGTGLPQGLPLSGADEIAELIAHCDHASARADEVRALLLKDQAIAGDASIAFLAELCRAIEQQQIGAEAWRAAVNTSVEHEPSAYGERVRRLNESLSREASAWEAWAVPLEVEETAFFEGLTRRAAPLVQLLQRAEECLRGGSTILDWCRYRRRRDELLHGSARPALQSFENAQFGIDQLPMVFEMALYGSLASLVFRHHPELQDLTGDQLRNYRQGFRDIEENLQKLERARIAQDLYHRPVEHGISSGPPSALTERALINHQIGLRRASVSSRELLSRASRALQQLKPCFMMSPATVAELLPRRSGLFDLVIIDEASQMLPADALGAVARAKNAVIVGDPQQLPPTTFFQAPRAGNENEDDSDGLAATSESILDLAMSAWHPHRYLRWHYRSRHSALIQFSNARFYDHRLIVFSGPDEDASEDGVNYHYVDSGVYRSDRTNLLEAKLIVQAVLRFATDRDQWARSLAIVAMNQPQRDLLDEMLDKAANENESFSRYLRRWEDTLEPFAVKNLESVQGDERDVIFISTVYGPQTPGGPVLQRFGPITQDGGERRLNVLFTRARWRIDVFSSMRANDIRRRPQESRGVTVMRDYLEYAATGRIATGVATGAPTESPFEQHVAERLEAEGYDVTPQVGVAGYRIDLGLKHSDYPHGFLAGLECDGATYHAAKSVRDRDRLREAVLRDLGWKIYRIWSTDWFDNPDREMQRLLRYLDEGLQEFNARPDDEKVDAVGAVDGANGRGEDVAEISGETTDARKSLTDTEGPQVESEVIEIGDTIRYRQGLEVKEVVIVDGPSVPEQGVINDGTPIARALMGRSRGETVTVRLPNTRDEVAIEEISKGVAEADEETSRLVQQQLFSTDDRRHPNRVSTTDHADALRDIIETEGPMITERLYDAYLRAIGLQRAGRRYRKLLNGALGDLERRNIVVIERRREAGSGYTGATIRLA